MWLRAEETEATLRSERDAFEEVRECLTDDFDRVQIALEEAEAREQEAVADCQHALRVFKFKVQRGVQRWESVGASPRYSLDIGFL